MAYRLFDEEAEENQAAPAEAQPMLQGAIGGSSLGQPVAASPAPQETRAGGGTGFVNFDRYFNANKDAATAAGDHIYGDVARRGAETKGNIDRSAASFSSNVDKGTMRFGGEAVGKPWLNPPPTTTIPQAGYGAPQYATTRSGLQGTPSKNAVPEVSLDRARELGNLGYQGPDNFAQEAGYGDWQRQAMDIASTARALGGDEHSRRAALDSMLGARSEGASRFDSALLGAASGDKFRKAKEQFGGLDKYLQDETARMGQLVNDAKATSSAAQDTYKGLADEAEASRNTVEAGRQAKQVNDEKEAANKRDYWTKATKTLDHRPDHLDVMNRLYSNFDYKTSKYNRGLPTATLEQMSDDEVATLWKMAGDGGDVGRFILPDFINSMIGKYGA